MPDREDDRSEISEEDSQASHRSGRQRAAGIYGTIVTAAVLTAGGGALSTTALAVTVVVTLVIYWLAEEYSELLGVHTQAGHLPSLGLIGSSLATTWPMVTSSFIPLLGLLAARLFGATPLEAAQVALGIAVVLLAFHSLEAGRAVGLKGIRLLLVTGVAALLGLAMVLLKSQIHQHH